MNRIVEESDLDFSKFHCCGDEDLSPFGCPHCRHMMVFCYECDTLYPDLNHLEIQESHTTASEPKKPAFLCPGCGYGFEWSFMNNPQYRLTRTEWIAAGHYITLKQAAS